MPPGEPETGGSGELGFVEFVLEAWATAVEVAEFGDVGVDLGELVGGGGEVSHAGESSCGVLVVLCAGVGEVVFDEASMDRQCGGRVDRFVGGDEIGPRPFVVEVELVRLLPGEVGVLQVVKREDHGLAWVAGECREDLGFEFGPGGAGGLVEVGGAGRGGPTTEHLEPCREQFVGPVSGEELTPVIGGVECLVSSVVIYGLFGPVDREVDLADLVERFRGVFEPGCDFAVAGVGADDRVDVTVEHCEAPVIPVEHEPFVTIRHLPRLDSCRDRCEAGADRFEPLPIRVQSGVAERWRVGDGVELEVVDLTIELEPDHPLDQP